MNKSNIIVWHVLFFGGMAICNTADVLTRLIGVGLMLLAFVVTVD